MFLPEILADRVAKNLLYIECLLHVSSDHWDIPTHMRKQLHTLQKRSQKKEVRMDASCVTLSCCWEEGEEGKRGRGD